MTLSSFRFFPLLLLCMGALTFNAALAQQSNSSGVGANYETRLTTLEDTVRALNGRMEQLEYTLRRIDQAVQRMQGDYDGRLAHLEASAVTTPPVQPQPIVTPPGNQTDNNINGSPGPVKTQDTHVTGGTNSPKIPPLPDTSADYGMNPQEQYERAFGLLRQANYDEAEKAFKTFIEKNPKDKLIDNAKYWYGETLYVRGRFDEAAVAFADAYQQNTQGNKAPDSLLKLAMSLSAINKVPDACTTLLELKSKYPNATATVRTRADEERLKLKSSH